MKLGAVFPQVEIGTDPAQIKAFAQGAEDLGFDYLLCYDHILGCRAEAYPEQKFIYTLEDDFHEPFVLYGYLAGVTRRIEMVTGILVLPQRETALVAKQAAQVALFSEGRLRLGVGVGWNRPEAEALGSDFGSRGRRLDEQLQVLEQLWSRPEVNFDGELHRLKSVGIRPMPPHPIPIWVGGYAPAAIRRAARHGQGWMPATLPQDNLQQLLELLTHELEKNGKSREDFGIDARILWREPQPQKEENLRGWREVGVTHLRCNTMGCGFSNADEHLDALSSFKQWVKGATDE